MKKLIRKENGLGEFRSDTLNGKVSYTLEYWESYENASGIGSDSQAVPASRWCEGEIKGAESGLAPCGVPFGTLVTEDGDHIGITFVGSGIFKGSPTAYELDELLKAPEEK